MFGITILADTKRLVELTIMDNGLIQLDIENGDDSLNIQMSVEELKTLMAGAGRIVWQAESDEDEN